MVVDIPANAVTVTTQFVYESLPAVTGAPAEYAFTGYAFHLDAYRDQAPCSGLLFEAPITVTIQYVDSGLVGLDEGTLELRYWDGVQWSVDGLFVVERNVLDNVLVVKVSHLSTFATFAQVDAGHAIFLPLVLYH
jgi:hypothetical protein